MALKVTKQDVWAGNLRDVPGGLADALSKLSAGGGSVEFLIARRDDKHVGNGKVFVTPVTSAKAKDAAGRAGLQHAMNVATLRVEGSDAKGIGAKITRAIADTGVNMRGVSAAVIGTKFVAYFGFDSEDDAETAANALKGVNARKRVSGGKKRVRKPTTRRKSR